MSFLSADNQTEIKRLFEGLEGDVRLIYFTQRESPLFVPRLECETCKDTRVLLEEVADLSDKIKLELHDFVADSGGVCRKCARVAVPRARAARLRTAGKLIRYVARRI